MNKRENTLASNPVTLAPRRLEVGCHRAPTAQYWSQRLWLLTIELDASIYVESITGFGIWIRSLLAQNMEAQSRNAIEAREISERSAICLV